LCDDSQCENGGTCADAWGSTDCEIADEPGLYMGMNTTDLVPYCMPDTCMNGGTCEENENRFYTAGLAGVGGVENATWCDCSTAVSSGGNYWGEWCQYASPCDTNPCLNDGECTHDGDSEFSCDCSGTVSPHTTSTPFTGDRCEMSGTTPCDYNPCLNGGDCVVDSSASGGFTCTCTASGWFGHTCASPPVDKCSTTENLDKCGRFGVCVPHSDESAGFTQCVCLYGWSGAACDTAPAPCDTQACQNEGVCIALNDGLQASCLCIDPWVGDKCQWNATVFAGASTSSASVFGALFLAVLALVF